MRANEVFLPGLMKGKVILVTGGGSGIGLGICIAFAGLGARVAVCGRTESKLKEAVGVISRAGASEVMYMSADVRKPDECATVVSEIDARWGKIDVLVNNAAGNFMSLAEDLSPNAFSTVIDIDLRGSFHMALAALPLLRKAARETNGATVIQISATLQYQASPFQGHAAAAKAGVDALTRTWAAEWAEDAVRVVGIAPGPIEDTEGGPTGRVFGAAGGGRADVRSIVPLGRFGTTDDIANAAVFLASPAGSFITGTTIVVDGLQWQATGAAGMLMRKEKIRSAMRKQMGSRERGSGSRGHEGDRQAKL